jgi:hypothetical protein
VSKTIYYVSSKLKHRNMWYNSGLLINSSWVTNEPVERSSQAYSRMWDDYWADMQDAQAFVMYLEPKEVPKGALVELGMAFQLGLPIYIIWPNPIYLLEQTMGTIIFHEKVTIVRNLEELPK